MSARALLATIMVISVPIAVNGAEPQTRTTPDSREKRICTVRTEIGSRLNRVRSCMNAAEREAYKEDQRRTMERIQSNKASVGQ